MRPEIRSYFKRLEIRIHTPKDPNVSRKGSHWAAYPTADWETMFEYTLKVFPNLEVIVISFELDEMHINY